jgi:hypothetical protein
MQTRPKQCRPADCAALFLSVVFHPVFVSFYAVLLFFTISHYFFYDTAQILRLIFSSAVIVPLLLQYLLFRLKILKSFFLEEIRARIGFTFLMAVLYHLLAGVMKPVIGLEELGLFFQGIAYALFLSVIFNLMKIKTGLHALAFSGLLYFLIHWSYVHRTNILDIIAGVIAVGTLVIASRIRLHAHTLTEIALGLLAGAIGQAIAFM